MASRQASPRVHQLLVDRWSPRSFDGRAVPDDVLAVILEAASLAPSAFNHQPWRFLFAHRDDEHWKLFLSLLVPFNAGWARNAGVLIFVVSDTKMRKGADVGPSYSHSFDAGAAWAFMALQATAMGYHAHAMTGIDLDRAYAELAITDEYRLEAAVAIGRRSALPRSEIPSDRRPVDETAFAGKFPNPARSA